KLLAAHRGGIKTVLIPEENAKDLVEISDQIKGGLEIVPVSRMDEVLARALTRKPEPIEWTRRPPSRSMSRPSRTSRRRSSPTSSDRAIELRAAPAMAPLFFCRFQGLPAVAQSRPRRNTYGDPACDRILNGEVCLWRTRRLRNPKIACVN